MKRIFLFAILLTLILSSQSFSQWGNFTGNEGMTVRVLESSANSIKIEYLFNGYQSTDMKINGETFQYLHSPNLVSTMEKGNPEIPIYKKSVVIPDLASMNYRIISEESEVISSGKIMPSKGHFTRDIDPNSVPYTFGTVYSSDSYYPAQSVVLFDPYIVRDLRGMTVQINPIQYNPVKNQLKISRRLVIELYVESGKFAVNPFYRANPLNKVSLEYAPIYRGMFLNYGMGNSRFDSIPEPGKMLVICPTAYMTAIQPFVQWKQQRGLNVTLAEYPTTTGTGNTAIKSYIQTMYNSPGSVTYIVLVGDVADIPTLNGQYESAPSDPCYVKLAGTDAYPDAFISRISCQTAASVSYVVTKLIKFERDIEYGAAWYNKGAGIGGPDVGGSPSYADSIRMNWVRDTLMNGGFTQVDKINGPVATAQTLINALNDGRYILNYIGHGSGTSWSNTGFSVTNAYQLANGWKNPFLVDVACLNGNFTLTECLAEALLRAGDTANAKGCSSIYASSTNASWVPPCDMQLFANHMLARQFRKTAGATSFFGVMYAMDLWGGSTGEGLKLMEQYNIFGDCSLLLTRGVPLGPSISHTQLPNTENLAGPYTVNCVINTANAPLIPNTTKLLYSRNNTSITDSVLMINTSGNNWSATIPGNNSPAVYRYYIKTKDTMNRAAVLPGGAPTNLFSFIASSDTVKPVITHTPVQSIPRNTWPTSVSASVTDNIGVDSVWVKWYKKPGTIIVRQFKLNNTGGSNYSALFNSDTTQVNFNDSIFYRVFARDNSTAHNIDSTALYGFKLLAIATATIGNGTASIGYPFYTYYMDSKMDMLLTASEIVANSGATGSIKSIGFNVISASSQPMNGFKVFMQHTSVSNITGFTTTGWTLVYDGTYTVPGTGWQFIDLQTPFQWNGSSNLLISICFNNSSFTSNSTVNGTTATQMVYHKYGDLSTGNGCTDALSSTSANTARPNIKLVIELPSPTGSHNNYSGTPDKFELSQNYPNPFNPVTKINYSIPKASFVTIKIFDILGREVKTLVNELKNIGYYSVDFNASDFSSGIYFYRLESNGFVDVKRMILLK